jgi:3-oxoacyl-(acyl-carrier-protein) synthase
MVNTFEEHSLGRDIAAYTVDLDKNKAKEILGKKGLRTKDKATKMLFAALEISFKDWLESLSEKERPGLMVGTAFGSIESVGNFITVGERNGPGAVNPRLFANTVINSAAGNANIRYGLKNHSGAMSTGFNSGLDALIWSSDYIRNGYLPSMFSAGLEELSVYTLYGMDREGCLSENGRCLPFSEAADGIVAGEGCGVLLLESRENARARDARIIAEIAGYANGFDPAGWNGGGEVFSQVLRHALADAEITADEIDFIVSDANGAVSGDAKKAASLSRVFSTSPPVTSYRSSFGDAYGASGALDMCGLLADMEMNRVSPALHQNTATDAVDVVTNRARSLESTYALVCGLSPEGHCSAVVVKKQ